MRASAPGKVRTVRASQTLPERLRARRGEIEEAALTRVFSLSDPTEGSDPAYLQGLRTAVAAALDYGIEALRRSEERPAPIPTALLSQARLAARNGVELETVLRRYLAGHALLDDFLIEEAERGPLPPGASLKGLLRIEAAALDRLLSAVSEEHGRELRARPGSPEERRARLIERLLAGEPVDTVELAYPFEGHHLGLLASGPGAGETIKPLATALDARLLAVQREGQILWAWLGTRRPLCPDEVPRELGAQTPPGLRVAIGEAGEGIAGWRLTHRQAAAALALALRGEESVVRYADVALLASILQDELLSASLQRLYIEPLEAERDGGEVAKETLKAYFAADRNVSSAAAALEVERRTVSSRLRAIERLLGRQLSSCATELSLALELGGLLEGEASHSE